MTTVDNAHLVNHVALRTTRSSVKAAEAVVHDEMVEVVLKREEEEHILQDEEIDSCEASGADDIDDEMLTVALANSVVDTSSQKLKSPMDSPPRASSPTRKRRRPSETIAQPTEDIKVKEEKDSGGDILTTQQAIDQQASTPNPLGKVETGTDGAAIMAEEPPGNIPGSIAEFKMEDIPEPPGEAVLESRGDTRMKVDDIEGEPCTVKKEEMPEPGDSVEDDMPEPPGVVVDDVVAAAKQVKQEIQVVQPPLPVAVQGEPCTVKKEEMPEPGDSVEDDMPEPPGVVVDDVVAAAKQVKQEIQVVQPPLPVAVQKPVAVALQPKPVEAAKQKASQPKNHPILPAAAASVPLAPASRVRQPVKKQKHSSSVPTRFATANKCSQPRIVLKKEELIATSGAVPNPLSRPIQSYAALPSRSVEARARASGTPPLAACPPESSAVPCPLPAAVPCPLPPPAYEEKSEPIEKRVTICEPPVTTRGRIFSVDLDPSTFDFSDLAADHSDNDKGDNTEGDSRSGPHTSDLAIFQRDRAFSFEFFNFTGDELLPAVQEPANESTNLSESAAPPIEPDEQISMRRPRGDSIIFDPVSFQDGGIHETNALLKARATSVDSTTDRLVPIPERKYTTSSAGVTATSLLKPTTTTSTPNPLPPYNVQDPNATGQMATLPSALSVSSVSGTTPATFQMELLNKDGRIGIYLPDARKARITRFHAKRKMRIWRKRIKYDCRKKLADSRPRIKGRFVKRSDMDED